MTENDALQQIELAARSQSWGIGDEIYFMGGDGFENVAPHLIGRMVKLETDGTVWIIRRISGNDNGEVFAELIPATSNLTWEEELELIGEITGTAPRPLHDWITEGF